MADDLRGKTALVTGAAKRIGSAISLALAREGANVVVHYRESEGEAAKLRAELETHGVRSWLLKADFEKAEEYGSLIARALETAGALDMLVNNASIFPRSKLSELTLEELRRNIEVNAWAPFVLSREFARLVGRGKIVNLVDSRTNDFDWHHVAYGLSKRLLLALTRATALEFAPAIAVNGVNPGLILPPPDKDEGYMERLAQTLPLKRRGDAEDIAEAVIFLLKSDFLTGEVINVDGGRHLREYKHGSHHH